MEDNKKRPMVTAIIATYNSEKILGKTLKALRNQTYPQELLEILVIDGMSKDSTREIAQSYNCKILDNEKVEQGNAKILGMQNASGKYVLFVDSDEVLICPNAIEKTINAFVKEKECHYAVCSGYKKPKGYPGLSGYISDWGDPFSFFVYRCPKDYRFYETFIKRNYRVENENDDYFVFDVDMKKHFILVEGGCGGAVMDMDYYTSEHPLCKQRIADLYHSFYEMLGKGNTKVLFIKEDPLEHYSSDNPNGYMRKLKWRVCNNIHFQEKGEEVFNGREKYNTGRKWKKYVFVPYAMSIIIPLLHSLPYAATRKNPAYLLHCLFSLYIVWQIILQTFLKFMRITPPFMAYGSTDKI